MLNNPQKCKGFKEKAETESSLFNCFSHCRQSHNYIILFLSLSFLYYCMFIEQLCVILFRYRLHRQIWGGEAVVKVKLKVFTHAYLINVSFVSWYTKTFIFKHAFLMLWDWIKYFLGLHKAQLHISTNFQNINIFQFSVMMLVSVSLLAADKHFIVMMIAVNGDLKCT